MDQQNIEKLRGEIREHINKLRTYTPKVGVFGNSGVGKSSLCNALFGREIAAISDVQACTREPQEILLAGDVDEGGITLVDVPGIGEDPGRHEEYTKLYKSLAPSLDLVLWAIKADDRNYDSGLRAYEEVFGGDSSSTKLPPVIFVITQADKMNPIRDWDAEKKMPGERQLANIVQKEHDVSSRFVVATRRIVTVSAEEHYNLKELVSRVVEALPKEKKFSFARETKNENVTEAAWQEAEQGLWESVKEWAGNAAGQVWNVVKDDAIKMVVQSAPKILKAVSSWLSRLW